MSFEINVKKQLSEFNLDISIFSKQGVLALLGESGSGKSMTLKSIAGITTPDEGYIKVNHSILFDSRQKINVPSRYRQVGYLFQNYALFPHMTVEENILICMKRKDKTLCQNLLKMFRVQELSKSYPRQLSGGQQQRVAMARMMGIEPEIILLDEPFAALDTNLRWAIESDLREFLNDYNKSTILVTHNKDEAFRLSDQVAIIHNGKIQEVGDKYEIFNSPKTISTAKIIGFQNFTSVKKINGSKVLLRDYNLEIPFSITDNIQYLAFRNYAFHFCKQEKNLEFPVSIIDFIEDTENKFLICKCNEKIITVQLSKKDPFYKENFLKKKNTDIILYYPYDEIVSLTK